MISVAQKIATRDAYGTALRKLGQVNPDVVALDGDLSGSTRSGTFGKEFPERFFNMGIAEQDMMATAAGLATCGLIPFASSFAVFATGRAYDQIRTSICYPKLNVKIVGSHSGVTVGGDGATHESIDDIALMRVLPNMVVLNPADSIEMEKMVVAASQHQGPVYIRSGRMPVTTFHEPDYEFEIGKGEILRQGHDIAIIATGSMVSVALEAAERLIEEQGIAAMVINLATIKPIDEQLIIRAAIETGKIITIEEHSIIGGLGSAVCDVLSNNYPTRVRTMGIRDEFGQSGKPEELLKYYHLTTTDIIHNALDLLR